MKTVLLAAAFAMLGIGTAQAADRLEPMPEAYAWSGFYVGGHLGYGEANYSGEFADSKIDDFDRPPQDLDLNGVAGGLQAGWNWQRDSIVLGIEADVTFTGWTEGLDPNSDGRSNEGDVDLLATLRLRAGFAADNWLFYVTAGGALAEAEYDAFDDEAEEGPDDHVDFDGIGYVVGGGVEWGVSEGWTLRAEGLYYGFDDEEDAGGLLNRSDTVDDDVAFEDAWIVRGGMNFRFR